MKITYPSPVLSLLALGLASALPAQEGRRNQEPTKPRPAVHKVGGLRDGVSFFPQVAYEQVQPKVKDQWDMQHYHTLEEIQAWQQRWAREYPDLVELVSVGKSFEGRDIWQLTLTNKKTGKDTDKPAFFMEGGRHSGEVSAVEATLYFIHHLLTNYGKDPEITRLLDEKAVYARPCNNPDGATMYLHTTQSNRSTVRPNDDDGDGLLDEDPGEDLDGDGFIRQMRKFVGKGKGSALKDPADPTGRLMKRVKAGEGDYELHPEGIDNDGDGRTNEDGIGGLDLHRNYPENWRPAKEATGRGTTQGGAGEFPLSEPETRAVFSFLMTHPNVGAVQSCDTTVPMLLRGPSTASTEDGMYPEDAALFKALDKEGLKITGYGRAGDTYQEYGGGSPLFGHGPDFGYSYFGVVWYGDEIWNGGRMKDYNGDGKIEELENLRWCDEHRPGKEDFKPWKAFQHPQLGEVEIGGWNPKFWSQNPPPELIEDWARREALFNVFLAQQLPQVKLSQVQAKPGKDGITEVSATLTNVGRMPTALDIAKRVKVVRPDALQLVLGTGLELVKPVEAKPKEEDRRGRGEGRDETRKELGWLKAGEAKTITWKVKGSGTLTVQALSTRGGVDRKEIQVGGR